MHPTKTSVFIYILLALVICPAISAKVVNVQSPEDWNNQLMKAGHSLVVVQFQVDWCSYCRRMKPVFTRIAEQYSDVVFLSVDVDEQRLIAWKNGIRSVPTYKYFKNLTLVDTVSTINHVVITDLITRLK